MRSLTLASLLILALAHGALAKETRTATTLPHPPTRRTSDQLVLVNAASRLGDVGKIEKLRKVLDSRGLLVKLPRRLEAALDGRAVQISDVDAIKDAYANQDFGTALKIIEEDEARILLAAAAGDPLPALSELAEWRGLIAAQKNNEDEAIDWFRTSYRFNSARQVDKRLASPAVRKLMKKARHETDAIGKLLVKADPDTAMVQIDGDKPQPSGTKIELPAGTHLVTITAEGRTSYSGDGRDQGWQDRGARRSRSRTRARTTRPRSSSMRPSPPRPARRASRRRRRCRTSPARSAT